MMDAIARRGMLLLFLFSLVLNLPYINVREFQGEEGRRVNIAVTMLQTGDWIIPHVEGAIYLKKPPFYNWVLAAFFTFTGTVSEAMARVPSALAAFSVQRRSVSSGGEAPEVRIRGSSCPALCF